MDNKSEKQIEAIVNLSDEDFLGDAVTIEKGDNNNIDVNIDQTRIKKSMNWSRVGSFLAITVFVFCFFFIQNSFSANLFMRLSFLGLIAILFSNFLSQYTGTMWSMGRLGTNITESSPGFLIKFVGWIMLLIPIIAELFYRI